MTSLISPRTNISVVQHPPSFDIDVVEVSNTEQSRLYACWIKIDKKNREIQEINQAENLFCKILRQS